MVDYSRLTKRFRQESITPQATSGEGIAPAEPQPTKPTPPGTPGFDWDAHWEEYNKTSPYQGAETFSLGQKGTTAADVNLAAAAAPGADPKAASYLKDVAKQQQAGYLAAGAGAAGGLGAAGAGTAAGGPGAAGATPLPGGQHAPGTFEGREYDPSDIEKFREDILAQQARGLQSQQEVIAAQGAVAQRWMAAVNAAMDRSVGGAFAGGMARAVIATAQQQAQLMGQHERERTGIMQDYAQQALEGKRRFESEEQRRQERFEDRERAAQWRAEDIERGEELRLRRLEEEAAGIPQGKEDIMNAVASDPAMNSKAEAAVAFIESKGIHLGSGPAREDMLRYIYEHPQASVNQIYDYLYKIKGYFQ
jgi:hypothetical protein